MTRPNFDKGLRPLKKKCSKKRIFGFDIETTNKNKDFVCASLVGNNYCRFFTDKDSLKKEIATNQIFRNSMIFASNLMFDFFGTFSLREGVRYFNLIESGGMLKSAITYCKYDKNDLSFTKKDHLDRDKEGKPEHDKYYKVTFCDTLCHIKASVKQLGKIINIPKLDPPDYLGKREPQTDEEWEYMKRYNIRDSYISMRFMEFLQDSYNDLGADLKITVASTSMDCFRRTSLSEFWKQEPKDNILNCYDSYYGGRTEAFERGLFSEDNYGKIKVYDVNSLYPFCLSNFKFPHPKKSYIKEKISHEDYLTFEGVGHFKINCPKDMHIPLLPVRTDKLIFPTGKIEGNYDFYSIRKAIKEGYEVESTGKGLIYEHRFNPFKPHIKKLYNKRKELKKAGSSMQLVVKLIMNSFYGKFAYKYMDKEFLGTADDVMLTAEENTIIPTSDREIFRILKSDSSYIPNYVFPIYALHTTALARGVMYDHFKHIGKDRVLYSDTDCIFTTRNIDSSLDLGGLEHENTFNEVMIIKPKFYGGVTKESGDVVKIKGIHSIKEYETMKKLLDVKGGRLSINQQRFRKLRGSIGSNDKYINEVYNMIKVMGLEDTKRTWERNKFSLDPQKSEPIAIENFK